MNNPVPLSLVNRQYTQNKAPGLKFSCFQQPVRRNDVFVIRLDMMIKLAPRGPCESVTSPAPAPQHYVTSPLPCCHTDQHIAKVELLTIHSRLVHAILIEALHLTYQIKLRCLVTQLRYPTSINKEAASLNFIRLDKKKLLPSVTDKLLSWTVVCHRHRQD